MSHNHFFKATLDLVHQFDERCQSIGFNGLAALVCTHLGSWIWLNDPNLSQLLAFGYISAIVGFYFSNLCYLGFKYLIELLIKQVDDQEKSEIYLFLLLSNRLISTIIGFGFSDMFVGYAFNSALVFMTGLFTAVFFLGFGVAMGFMEIGQDTLYEPGKVGP